MESQKTIDNKTFYKAADVSQVSNKSIQILRELILLDI
jgi:TATA-binding protein-associated factor Taf7